MSLGLNRLKLQTNRKLYVKMAAYRLYVQRTPLFILDLDDQPNINDMTCTEKRLSGTDIYYINELLNYSWEHLLHCPKYK